MATKRQKSAVGVAEKELKAVVDRLRVQLAAAGRSAQRWRSKAKEHRSVAAVRKWKGRARRPAPVMAPPGSAPAPTPESAVRRPDDSWTVAELRAEARSRGLVGYSRKNKAELLQDLRG